MLPSTSKACAPAGFVFFNDTATTEIYTLSLHDALPVGEEKTPRRTYLRPPERRSGCFPAVPYPSSGPLLVYTLSPPFGTVVWAGGLIQTAGRNSGGCGGRRTKRPGPPPPGGAR